MMCIPSGPKSRSSDHENKQKKMSITFRSSRGTKTCHKKRSFEGTKTSFFVTDYDITDVTMYYNNQSILDRDQQSVRLRKHMFRGFNGLKLLQ